MIPCSACAIGEELKTNVANENIVLFCTVLCHCHTIAVDRNVVVKYS